MGKQGTVSHSAKEEGRWLRSGWNEVGEGRVGLGLRGGPWLWRQPVSPRTPWRAPGEVRWKMQAAHGALPGPCVLGDPAPLNSTGPFPRRGGQPGETEGSEVGKAIRTAV